MAITKIKTANEEEWRELRHKYIGGSDAAAVVGLNPYVTPLSLWAEKTDQTKPFMGNLTTELGHYLEPFVAQKWMEQTGKKVHNDNLSFLNDEYPFAIANIDRKVEGENAGLEIKTCSDLRLKDFKGGEYPSNYYVQCVHYMAVTGYDKWYLGVLVGNRELYTYEIERDEAEIESLMYAERTFWNKYVKRMVPPPVDGEASTTKAVKEITADEGKMSGELNTELQTDLYNRKEIMEQIKILTTMKDEIDNRIKMEMGSYVKGTCGNFNINYKYQKNASIDMEAFKADYPQIDLSLYRSQSRVLRITEARS